MAANVLYGLLCVRLLPAEEYAKFVIVFGVQATLLILMDANFSATLIPLVGERVDDRRLIADYLASLRQLSIWAYAIIGVAAVFCFPFLVRNRGWSALTVAAMVVILLISTWFMRMSAAYGTTIILLRDRSSWYKSQLISSLGTLALLAVLHFLHWFGAFQAILLNVAGIAFVGIFCFFRARTLLGGTGKASPQKRSAIVRLAMPNMPQAFFYAFQGQISLFLITYLGHSKGIASVGALGRLGQIFAIFLQANSLLVEPYFAKLPKEALKRSYTVALFVAACISLSVMFAAISFPQLILWVLGPNYSGLQYEVKLAVIAGAISCFSGVLWGIHSARRFVYWWNVSFSIGITLVVQILFIVKADMSTVRGVLWLNLATNAASLLVNVLSGAYGFRFGPRQVEHETVPVGEQGIEAEASLDMVAAQDGSTLHSQPRLIEPETID